MRKQPQAGRSKSPTGKATRLENPGVGPHRQPERCSYCNTEHRGGCPGEFLYNSAKGRLAESIVRELLSKAGYTVIPSGFESLFPELSSKIYGSDKGQLSSEPDFVAYRGDERAYFERHLVEVKYRKRRFANEYRAKNLAEILSPYLWWPPFRLVVCWANDGGIEGVEVSRDLYHKVYKSEDLVRDPFSPDNRSRIQTLLKEEIEAKGLKLQPIEDLFGLDKEDDRLNAVRSVARRLLQEGIGYADGS